MIDTTKILIGGGIGAIVLLFIISEYSVNISSTQVTIISIVIGGIIIAYFLHKSGWFKFAEESVDPSIKAIDYAINWWKSFPENKGLDITYKWLSPQTYGKYKYYGIFLKRAVSQLRGNMVWIVVMMSPDGKNPVSVEASNSELTDRELSSVGIEKVADRMWKFFNPNYAGAPNSSVKPGEDIGILKNRERRTISHRYESLQKPKQDPLIEPAREEDGTA